MPGNYSRKSKRGSAIPDEMGAVRYIRSTEESIQKNC